VLIAPLPRSLENLISIRFYLTAKKMFAILTIALSSELQHIWIWLHV